VQQLKQADYEVEYQEFNGFHTVPPAQGVDFMPFKGVKIHAKFV
jgi:hypothetical protein